MVSVRFRGWVKAGKAVMTCAGLVATAYSRYGNLADVSSKIEQHITVALKLK